MGERRPRLIERWDDQPLRRKGLVVIAIPLLLLLALLPNFLFAQRALAAEQGRIEHTLQVRNAIDTVLALQLNAQTGIRGYLLTNDPLYLGPYEAARAQLPAALDTLGGLVADNPGQVARVRGISDLLAREMVTLATLRANTQVGTEPTAEQLAVSKGQMDELRAALAAMTVEEDRLLDDRRQEAERLTLRAQIIGGAAIVVGLIGSLLASLLFTRGIARRVGWLNVAASGLAQGLAPGIPPRARDEIGAVGRQLVESGHLLMAREEALREAAAELEGRVRERTAALGAELAARQEADQALVAANARLVAVVGELERQTRDMGVLNELGDYLQACRTPEEAATVIHRLGGRLFPKSAGFVGVFRASQNLVEPLAAWGPNLGLTQGFAPESCWALRRGRPHHVAHRDTDLPCAHTPEPGAQGYRCLPLLADGEALGMLHLRLQPEADTARAAAQERLAVAVAERVGLTLATLRLQARLRDQSIRDPLTGLYNRRYLEESLARELQRAGRQSDPVGIIMLDIDHFKRFNDTFGHQAGDALLREVGNYILTHIRGEDLACRYGGEELALILPGADAAVAEARAEALRAGLRGLTVLHQRQVLGQITASFGVAVFPEHGDTVEDIVRAADTSLYRAKREGRDRIALAS